MALRACNNPIITKSALNREITKLVIVHAEAEVGCLHQARKADVTDTAGGLVSFARGDGGTGETGETGGRESSKRQRCDGGTANEVSPISESEEETHAAASTPTRPRAKLSAPSPARWRTSAYARRVDPGV